MKRSKTLTQTQTAAPQQSNEVRIGPQSGPQMRFLSCTADIAGYGGAAGGGKSWSLLLDPLRFAALKPVAGFGAVIFRRTSKQIMQEGGLWDEAGKLYPLAEGISKQTRFEWVWPRFHTKIRFGYMEHEKDRFQWQGSQIAYIGFDELTHFTRAQFVYMFSRNRSLCGVKPRMRATMNPDADSWVKDFFAPWVDDTFKYPAQSGEIRYFLMEDDNQVWLPPGEKHPDAKSCTFIFANVYDNKILLQTNPEYLTWLKALPLVERMRLLNGDWNIRPSGNMFKREWFKIVETPPAAMEKTVRYWDFAATEETGENDPDYTVGVKMGRREGMFYVLDVQRDRLRPAGVEALVRTTAELDGRRVAIYIEQEPGSAGVNVIARYKKLLAGYTVVGVRTTGNKMERAAPVSSQAEARNIVLVQGPWNLAYINEHCAFPTKGAHDDQVDANSGAFEQLTLARSGGMVLSADTEAAGEPDEDYYEDDEWP